MAEEAIGIVARLLLWIGRLLFELLVYGFLYATGRVGLPILTFGRWRVVALTDHKSNTGVFCKRQPDGTLLFDEEMGIFFGVLIWILIGLLVFIAVRLASFL